MGRTEILVWDSNFGVSGEVRVAVGVKVRAYFTRRVHNLGLVTVK